MPDIELTVLGQIDRSVLGLNLPGILEHAHIDEQVARRLQRTREINVRPLSFILRQEVDVATEIRFFFGA